MIIVQQFLISSNRRLCITRSRITCPQIPQIPKKLKNKHGPWYAVFEEIRIMFKSIIWDSWQQLYELSINPETGPPSNWFGIPIEVSK